MWSKVVDITDEILYNKSVATPIPPLNTSQAESRPGRVNNILCLIQAAIMTIAVFLFSTLLKLVEIRGLSRKEVTRRDLIQQANGRISRSGSGKGRMKKEDQDVYLEENTGGDRDGSSVDLWIDAGAG